MTKIGISCMDPRVASEGKFFYYEILLSLSYIFLQIGMEAATPGEIARAEDPALSGANVFVFATSNRRSKGSG